MNFFDHGLLKAFIQTFTYPEPAPEIGSLLADDCMKYCAEVNLSPEKIIFETEDTNFFLEGPYDRLDRID